MSSERIDLGEADLILNIKLGTETEETMKRIEEFSVAMRELVSISQTGATAFANIGKSAEGVSKVTVNLAAEAEKMATAIGVTTDTRKQALESAANLAAGIKLIRTTTAASNEVLKQGEVRLKQFDAAIVTFRADPTASQLKNLAGMVDTFSKDTIGAGLALGALQKGFSRAGPLLSKDFVAGLMQQEKSTEGVIQRIYELDQAMGQLSGKTQVLQQLFANPEQAEYYTRAMQQASIEMYKLRLASQMVVGQLGAVNMAYMDLGRTAFWTGLGTMFALMSFQRYARTGTQIEAAELSLTRALQSESEAQEKLRTLRDRGITSGRQYYEVSMAAKEASMARKLAEDRLRDSIINQNLALLQLAFGTFPTVIRTTVDLTREIMKMMIVRNMHGDTISKENAALVGNAALTNLNKGAKDALTASTWGATLATLGLTAALTLGISALTTWLATMKAEEDIKRMNKEFEKMKTTLTVRHSPNLYETFGVLAIEVDRSAESMSAAGEKYKRITQTLGALKAQTDLMTEAARKLRKEAELAAYTGVPRIGFTALPSSAFTTGYPAAEKMATRGYTQPEINRLMGSQFTGPIGVETGAAGLYGPFGQILQAGYQALARYINMPLLTGGVTTSNINVNLYNPVIRNSDDAKIVGAEIVSGIYRRGAGRR